MEKFKVADKIIKDDAMWICASVGDEEAKFLKIVVEHGKEYPTSEELFLPHTERENHNLFNKTIKLNLV